MQRKNREVNGTSIMTRPRHTLDFSRTVLIVLIKCSNKREIDSARKIERARAPSRDSRAAHRATR
jgi:hypothetical protein